MVRIEQEAFELVVVASYSAGYMLAAAVVVAEPDKEEVHFGGWAHTYLCCYTREQRELELEMGECKRPSEVLEQGQGHMGIVLQHEPVLGPGLAEQTGLEPEQLVLAACLMPQLVAVAVFQGQGID